MINMKEACNMYSKRVNCIHILLLHNIISYSIEDLDWWGNASCENWQPLEDVRHDPDGSWDDAVSHSIHAGILTIDAD